jgi:hypothetical protein
MKKAFSQLETKRAAGPIAQLVSAFIGHFGSNFVVATDYIYED